MNKTIFVIAIAAMISGCSTFNKSEDKEMSSTPVAVKVEDKAPTKNVKTQPSVQRMSTNFKRKGLKIEWSCTLGESDCISPTVNAIEVVGYATTNGTSENSRDSAFKLAELRAKAKLRKFIYEEISTSTVTKVITKNVEKSNEKFESNNQDDSEISVDDTDISTSPNRSNTLRSNTNHTVRQITETIRSNAAGILKGIQVLNEDVVNGNNVSVTIRWDRNMENATEYLRNRFGS